jgi:hypothetical protein
MSSLKTMVREVVAREAPTYNKVRCSTSSSDSIPSTTTARDSKPWSSDHAHPTCQDVRFAPDSFSERRLVSRPHGNSGRRHISPGGAIDQVHTGILQAPGQRYGIVEGPPAFPPIGCRNAHEQRRTLWPRSADCTDQLDRQAPAVLERTAVTVGAAIDERREELRKQAPVGGVDLDDTETCLPGSAGSVPGPRVV